VGSALRRRGAPRVGSGRLFCLPPPLGTVALPLPQPTATTTPTLTGVARRRRSSSKAEAHRAIAPSDPPRVFPTFRPGIVGGVERAGRMRACAVCRLPRVEVERAPRCTWEPGRGTHRLPGRQAGWWWFCPFRGQVFHAAQTKRTAAHPQRKNVRVTLYSRPSSLSSTQEFRAHTTDRSFLLGARKVGG
jgi:hypothetical protein